jgi:hypothetical protein
MSADVLPGADLVPGPGFDSSFLHAAGVVLLGGVQHPPPYPVFPAVQLPGRGPHLRPGQYCRIDCELLSVKFRRRFRWSSL